MHNSMSLVTRADVDNAKAWIEAFYEACDSSDVTDWVEEFFEPDATVHLSNLPVIQGHARIITHFERHYAQLSFVHHVIKAVDVSPERCYVHVEVTSVVDNDPEQIPITLRGLTILVKKHGEAKLASLHVLIDSTPVLNQIQMYS